MANATEHLISGAGQPQVEAAFVPFFIFLLVDHCRAPQFPLRAFAVRIIDTVVVRSVVQHLGGCPSAVVGSEPDNPGK